MITKDIKKLPKSVVEINITVPWVDMQPTFEASQEKWIIENIKKEIHKAKRKKDFIILVRYRGHPKQDQHPHWQIDTRIISAIGRYKNLAYVTKTRMDGSTSILRACKEMGFPDKKLRIVGVNTDSCVAETVNNLSRKLPSSKILLVTNACHTDQQGRNRTGRKYISRRKNIKRIKVT